VKSTKGLFTCMRTSLVKGRVLDLEMGGENAWVRKGYHSSIKGRYFTPHHFLHLLMRCEYTKPGASVCGNARADGNSETACLKGH
jgi:hypothetical protein